MKALFLDRDGTLNVYKEYMYRKEDFEFRLGMVDLIKRFNKNGWLVIIITNQSGIGRGYFSEEDVLNLHSWVDSELLKHDAHIDAWYYCPHTPKDNCDCRKPHTGMIEQACRDFEIALSESLLLGDRYSDLECGKRIGIKSMFVEDYQNENSN